MNDVKRLLDEAAPLPWTYEEDRPMTPPVEGAILRMYGDRVPLRSSADAALIVHAVNTLPAYEAAVHALERLVKHHYFQNGDSWCEEGVAAREALRRVRGEPVEASR